MSVLCVMLWSWNRSGKTWRHLNADLQQSLNHYSLVLHFTNMPESSSTCLLSTPPTAGTQSDNHQGNKAMRIWENPAQNSPSGTPCFWWDCPPRHKWQGSSALGQCWPSRKSWAWKSINSIYSIYCFSTTDHKVVYRKKNRAQWCLLEGKRLTIKAIVCLSGPMSCMKIWCWEYKSLHFSWVYSICPIFPL